MDDYNKNEQKVLNKLFSNPTSKFHIRELARIVKLNPNTIINIINKLEKQAIVEKKQKKHITEISLNLENKETIWKKRIFNLSKIYSSGIIKYISKAYSPNSISLIGSYSRGEDIEKSDIDIVILTKKKDEKPLDLTKFEKIFSKNIHLIITRKEKISNEFFNNLINGIILYGAISK